MSLRLPLVHHLIIIVLVIIYLLFPVKGSAESIAKSGCPEKCGNITIPYPFGIGEGCFLAEEFEIICNESSNTPFLFKKYEVVQIFMDYLHINHNVSNICYTTESDESISVSTSVYPFSFSYTQNKFVAIGSDIFAFITQSANRIYETGCASLAAASVFCSAYTRVCREFSPILSSTTCNGIYCCETTFPRGIQSFDLQLNIMNRNNSNPKECGYALIASTNFSISYGVPSEDKVFPYSEVVPAVLEWAVGDIPCNESVGRKDYACGNNSVCIDSAQGYKCNCSVGYRGNPYLPNGCQDINECMEKQKHCQENAICINYPGNFSCLCPHGYHGNASKYGNGCMLDKGKLPVPLIVSLGIGIATGLLSLVAVSLWMYQRLEKRKKTILKRKYFDENGGRLLRQIISSSKGSVEKTKLYIIEELEKATDNFNVGRILGKGGFGTVYKGMLQDGSIVAIKKSNKVDEMQMDQFVNEVFILSQLDHSNIVKLLGCCLETEVPLLVYEHVSNGTLSDHLHGKDNRPTLSWKNRLRIASEIASALHYLHSHGSAAIFHRDIKSSNILLDENLRAIVADFGISRSVSVKKTHLTASVVQGTYGYLDPEYFRTWQFTGKSDVYAFGVILAELLTGETAVRVDRNEQGLAAHFISAMENNLLPKIVDKTVVINEDDWEEIFAVARIAEKCLELRGDKRPTMGQVALDLDQLFKRIRGQQFFEDPYQNNNYYYENGRSYSYRDGAVTEDGRSTGPVFLNQTV